MFIPSIGFFGDHLFYNDFVNYNILNVFETSGKINFML